MIVRFVRSNAPLLFLMTCLAGVNAGAAFFALSSIVRVSANASANTASEAILVVVLLVGSAALTQRLSSRLGAAFTTQLRTDFVKKLLYQAYTPGSAHKGRSVSAFINDIAEIGPLALMVPLTIYNILFAIVGLVYLFFLSAPLAVLVIVELIAMGSLSILLQRPIPIAFNQLRQADDAVFSNVRCLEDARKELLTNQYRADHFHNRVMLPSISISKSCIDKAHTAVGYAQAWSSNILYIIIIVTVLFSTIFFPASRSHLSAFIVGCLIIVGPVNALLGSVQQLSRGIAAVRRLDRFHVEVEPGDTFPRHTQRPEWKSIELRGVRYSYNESEAESSSIGPIDITISRGEIVFLVGANGSGKTTILLLLAGLLSPQRGDILLDEQRINLIKWTYRAILSVVFCDFHVFEHLLDAKGDPAHGAEVERLVSLLGLEEVIAISNAQLLKTDVSAGQRKRLALLQLLLEDRDVLVLDEMAADLDPEFKRYFYEHLLAEFKASGKTVILATHDAEYFRCADRLLTLENGFLLNERQGALDLGSAV